MKTPDNPDLNANQKRPAASPAATGSAPDPRIAWHIKRNPRLSELAVMLAIATHERCDYASYEWESKNAEIFQSILEQNAPHERWRT